MSKRTKPTIVEITFTREMVRDVILAWERDHPGNLDKMTSEEFADRLMKKIEATARIVEGGKA
jgi:hypothetical protein